MNAGEEKLGNGSREKESLISRRKLLASIGAAGIGMASSSLLNGAGQAYAAAPEEKKNKVKDLMAMNIVEYTTIAELRGQSIAAARSEVT
ncbi:hypothetical protein [Paenibacillus contaminans]|uniref:Uncharacterized protein n=1 Tax=Paenibacillus contaminans TaxID=450362 RepID=A0A329M772_9BACL|nr:hypothetical protein [Paenibacillus contaminans]RAV15588.1 hypothetical protein DQG23_29875 [Paenibacillus contaminans]